MKLLITDLDNTLYDWVTYFATSFERMIVVLERELGESREVMLPEFKAVHQRYHNSEQPFAILEIDSIRRRFPHLDRHALKLALDPALHEFNKARRETLRLYDGVSDTLRALRQAGVRIVGHTEAISVNAFYRLSMLGLVPLFDRLYCLDGGVLPHPVPGSEGGDPAPANFLRVVPKSERKPNPELLKDICRRESGDVSEAWYVGDSLSRDMAMAKDAGVIAVWARYGLEYEPSLWKLLVRITHWTDDDVAREAELRRRSTQIQPDFAIDSFGELLAIVGVGSGTGPGA